MSNLYLFFLYFGDYRDLHSFPTRRSSDLGTRKHFGCGWQRESRFLGGELANRRNDRFVGRDGFFELIFAVLHLKDKLKETDRKSTRLNSSHLGISYAVFCLKKKKKKLSSTMAPEIISTRSDSFNPIPPPEYIVNSSTFRIFFCHSQNLAA